MEKAFVAYDFTGAKVQLGKWRVLTASAIQTDEKRMFAKLVVPLEPVKGPISYQVTGRATGVHWVGWGMHVALGPVKDWYGYGAGTSL